MRLQIIANPHSGKGNGQKVLDAVTAHLDTQGADYSVSLTNGIGHARELAREACAAGVDTVVALGGDGTFHEALNGMDFERARLGLIPAGRGNDFARGTAAASSDPITAISDILRGEPRDLDYISVSDKRCINVAGTGLDVEVLLRTADKKNKITYVNSLVRCLLHYKPYDISVTLDGETTEYPNCIMVGVCNGTQFGGGIRVSPLSVTDDGKLDLMIIVKPKHVPTIFVMPGFTKGKHIGKDYAKHVVCESVHIDTPAPVELDGEIYYDLKFDAHVVKGGLKTFVTTPDPKK